jgi:hypothetical protein
LVSSHGRGGGPTKLFHFHIFIIIHNTRVINANAQEEKKREATVIGDRWFILWYARWVEEAETIRTTDFICS